jgi:hypothetical protein
VTHSPTWLPSITVSSLPVTVFLWLEMVPLTLWPDKIAKPTQEASYFALHQSNALCIGFLNARPIFSQHPSLPTQMAEEPSLDRAMGQFFSSM